MPARHIEYIRVDQIVPAATNPKKHALDGIGDSMARFGYTEPVVMDERTGRLIAGHGRIESLAARHARGEAAPEGIEVDGDGGWMLPVVRGWASSSDSAAAAALVASNKLVEAGGWDEEMLAELLGDYRSDPDWLTGTGYGEEEVVEFLARLAPQEEAEPPDPDALPEPSTEVVSRPGDVWILGPHKAMVGDCRDSVQVAALLAGVTVNLAFTSPPYADRREYDATTDFRPVHPDEYVDWFEPVQERVAEHLAADGSWFVNIKANATELDQELYVLDLVLAHARRWGWHMATEFCWERNGIPGRVFRRFKNQFEPIYQFTRGDWKIRPDAVRSFSLNVPIYDPDSGQGETSPTNRPRPRRANHTTENMSVSQGSGADIGAAVVEGLAYPGNRLPTFAGSHTATGHTAAFPVGLPAFFVKAYTDPGDVVFDPFGGSGSTLIAAHQEGRVGRTSDVSPSYVDTICRRFQMLTNVVPILERTGEPHDFLTGEDTQPAP